IAIEQRTKPSKMRGLKKADSDADFVFMGRFVRDYQPSRTAVTVYYPKSEGLFGWSHTGRNARRRVAASYPLGVFVACDCRHLLRFSRRLSFVTKPSISVSPTAPVAQPDRATDF